MPKKRIQLEKKQEFLARLCQVRKRAGFKQSQVAERLGVSQASYGRWEKGVDDLPIGALPILSRLFGLSIDWLLTGQDVPALPEKDQDSDEWELNKLQSQVDFLLQQEDRFLRNEKKHLEIRQKLHEENERLWQSLREKDALLKETESKQTSQAKNRFISADQNEQMKLIYDALQLEGELEPAHLLEALVGLSNILKVMAGEPGNKKGQKKAV
ncbi:helix-turn-helix domain-containing protein [Dethiosulfatarculus sandiegensis]|uniref:Cro/Cl family transcriptional regulator n=1 Tax=Dethiosulfatarculus sandiegensis TaxID=1429043 RepID=A0A0D2K0A8_9BACT|nr:helix-turn-helix domain-containing protein [Dethiosulfatarculus sandiegensis]KIX15175.1 Cro/Cl family transcriptional regulator [Dethiosulfatarculus sandiegensis]